MMPPDPMIVDTCVLAPAFSRPHGRERREVDILARSERLVMLGVVAAEFLRGLRTDGEAGYVASLLRKMNRLEPTWEDWVSAGRLGRITAAKGADLPLADLLIAAVALRSGALVYTTDPHFDRIDGLRRYLPGRDLVGSTASSRE